MTFLGAVFAEKIVDLSLAASLTGKTPIRDLTSLFGEERLKGHPQAGTRLAVRAK
jgi:hypothetical protein